MNTDVAPSRLNVRLFAKVFSSKFDGCVQLTAGSTASTHMSAVVTANHFELTELPTDRTK